MANIINFNDDKDKGQEQGQSNLATGSSGGSASITPVNGQSSGAQPAAAAPGSASSGKFTNIQKYIGANKGAGQQVASGINKEQDQSLRGGRIAQEDEAKKFQAGAQAANEVLTRGQGYNQQLQQDPNFRKYESPASVKPAAGQPQQQAPTGDTVVAQPVIEENPNPLLNNQPQQTPAAPATGFNAEDFVSDANRLQDFTKIKVGQGIDDVGLTTQAQKSQDLAGQNRVAAEELANRSNTEAGRFGLISQAFARPNYTQGQKRLDNLFLTGSGNKSIESIQQKGQQNLGTAKDIYGQATAGVNQAGQIKSDEATLSGNLQNRANELESGLLSNLESMIPQTNQDRDALRQKWQQNFNTLVGKGGAGSQIADDIWNELQLQQGERTYNVLNDPNLTLRNIADISDRNAAGFADIANQADVNQYAALAKLAQGGLDEQGNYSFDPSGLKLTKASDMEVAAKAKTGEDSLRNRLNTAEDKFLRDALSRTITGTGEDTGSSGLFGRGGTASSQFSINLADYLKSMGMDAGQMLSQREQDQNYAQTIGKYSSPTNLAFQAVNNATLGPLAGIFNGPAQLPEMLSGSLASTFGLTGSGGSSVAADARARQNLLDTLTNTLSKEGFNNYLTRGGNINTDSISNASRNVETQRLSDRNDNSYYTNPLNTKEQQQAYSDNIAKTAMSNALAGIDLAGTGRSNPYADKTIPELQRLLAEQQLNSLSSMGTMINTNTNSVHRAGYETPDQGTQVANLTPAQREAYIQKYIDTVGSSYTNQGQTAVNNILSNRQATENKYNAQQEALRNELNNLRGLPYGYTGK